MKTTQMPEGAVRFLSGSYPPIGCRRLILWTVLILPVLLLVGCGKRIPDTWPDLSVDDGVVYVASSQVFALKADTGEVMWRYPEIVQRSGGLLGGCSGPQITDGPFNAAPIVSEEFVFLGSGGELQRSIWGTGENRSGLRALNKSGVLQWKSSDATDRSIASPAVAGGTVYLSSSDRRVYAISIETRKTRWAFETNNWVWATPLIAEGNVYIASMDHVLYAVDDATGQLKWAFDQSSSALPAAPAFADGILYLCTLDGHVYAINTQTGKSIWEQKVEGNMWATPIVEGDRLYFGTLNGTIYALGTADGQVIWSKNVGGEVRGMPAFANGKLYFGCENGQLYAFDAQTGDEVISPLGQKIEKASIYASPVFNGQNLFILSTDGTVYALDLEMNAIVWEKNPLSNQEGK